VVELRAPWRGSRGGDAVAAKLAVDAAGGGIGAPAPQLLQRERGGHGVAPPELGCATRELRGGQSEVPNRGCAREVANGSEIGVTDARERVGLRAQWPYPFVRRVRFRRVYQ